MRFLPSSVISAYVVFPIFLVITRPRLSRYFIDCIIFCLFLTPCFSNIFKIGPAAFGVSVSIENIAPAARIFRHVMDVSLVFWLLAILSY